MEKIEQEFDRGVVSPSHPPIIEVAAMKATGNALKAGTVLKTGSAGYEAAADSATPAAVLLEDVPAHADKAASARVLLHGIVVGSRLLNASQEAPSDTLMGKLPGTGIYATQKTWSESNYN